MSRYQQPFLVHVAVWLTAICTVWTATAEYSDYQMRKLIKQRTTLYGTPHAEVLNDGFTVRYQLRPTFVANGTNYTAMYTDPEDVLPHDIERVY